MSDIGADVLAEWRVVPEDVASLSVFAFCSRGGFVVESVLVSAFVKYIYVYIYIYINKSIWIIVYPCGIVLDAFAEHGISESWTNQ